MRNVQREKQEKRRKIRAEKFLKDLASVRNDLRANRLPIQYYADELAHLWRMPSDSTTILRIAKWIDNANTQIEDVYPFSNPVRLYWAHSTVTDDKGKNGLSFMPDQEQLRDFVRPGHIYLDVTFGILEDVIEIWGERKPQKEKRREVSRKIPDVAQQYAALVIWALRHPHKDTRVSAESYLKEIGFRFSNIKKPPSKRELASHIEKYLRTNLDDYLDDLSSPGVPGGNTVSEIQDFLNSGHRWVSPMKGEGRAGRKRGHQTQPWAQWRDRTKIVGWQAAREEYLAGEARFYGESEGDSRGWKVSEERRRALKRFRENVPKPK